VAFDNPMNYNHQAARYAESLDNAVWTNQFDNQANREAHILTTGPEIWNQTDGGNLDAFICATGTGGTLAGVTRYLSEKTGGRVEGWLADPPGSVLFNLVENGKSRKVLWLLSARDKLIGSRYRPRKSDEQPRTRSLPPDRRHPHPRFRIHKNGLPLARRRRLVRRCLIRAERGGRDRAGEEEGEGKYRCYHPL